MKTTMCALCDEPINHEKDDEFAECTNCGHINVVVDHQDVDCPHCGAVVEIQDGLEVVECPVCGKSLEFAEEISEEFAF
jgi:DNA-directed RNA polymerase subunit RPC12/RpoP